MSVVLFRNSRQQISISLFACSRGYKDNCRPLRRLFQKLFHGGSASQKTMAKGIAEGADIRRQSRNAFASALRSRRGDRST
jgi:hypothetical protein